MTERGQAQGLETTVAGDGVPNISALDGNATLRRWSRRVLTVGGYATFFVVLTIALPAALPLALIRDLAQRTRLGATRTLVLLYGVVTCEVLGVAFSFLIALRHYLSLRRDPARYIGWNFALQRWWASTLAAIGLRLFRVRVVVERPFEPGPRPVLLLMRHTSFMDVLFPAVLVSAPHRLLLRYVLKRELLWDPCLDIVGHRLPNCFVRRGGADTAHEIRQVARLAEGLSKDEGVLIFPEGTRFTEQRRARLIEKFEQRGDGRLARLAKELDYVLPPHANGVIGVLDRNPEIDAVFCAHAGLEGKLNFRSLLSGDLVGREVRVAFWRVPAEAVPRGRAERVQWLSDEWRRVDEFIRNYYNNQKEAA